MKKTSRLAFAVNFVLALLAAFGKFYGPLLRQPNRVPQAQCVTGAEPAAAVLVATSPASPEPPPT